jgi:hypothetical protein
MLVRAACLTLATATVTMTARAQDVAFRFRTGVSRDLVSLTFDNLPRQTLPPQITVLSGAVRLVTHLGQPMLRVAERTALLVHLPEVLPQDFTLEFDIVPKTCCLPEDLAVEGTRFINQGPTSANVLWHYSQLLVVGGSTSNYHGRVPEPLSSSLRGTLARIVINVQGDDMTLLTNGQQLFSLTNRKFARDSILRVFLGGQNDSDRAVYLARLRVVAHVLATPVAADGAPRIFTPVSSRSIALPGFTATGNRVASRTLSLAGFEAIGPISRIESQSFSLAGFTASGRMAQVASRTIGLLGFSATGGGQLIPSRTIALGGFSATGTSTSVASRTFTLAGWTAAGPP